MNQKQVIGVIVIVFVAGGFIIMNQTPENKKADAVSGFIRNFETLKTRENLVNRDFTYLVQAHGSGREDKGPPDQDHLRQLQSTAQSLRADVHEQNADFNSRYNEDYKDFRSLDFQIDGLLQNIQKVISSAPKPQRAPPNPVPLPREYQRPMTINIDKSVHNNQKTFTEAQRLQQIRQGDRIMNEGDRTLNEAARTQQSYGGSTHNIGGDRTVRIGDIGNSKVHAPSNWSAIQPQPQPQPIVQRSAVPAAALTEQEVSRIQGYLNSIDNNPDNGNGYDPPPPTVPDQAATNLLNRDATNHKPALPIDGKVGRDSAGNNMLLSDQAVVEAKPKGKEETEDPKVNDPKVPALPRTNTAIEIPITAAEPPVGNPFAGTIPSELKPQVQDQYETETKRLKRSIEDLGRKRSGSTVEQSAKRPKVKPTPESKPIGNERTQTQIDIPDKLKVVVTDNKNVVVTPQPVVSSQATATSRAATGFSSLPESPPDVPDKPATPKKKKGRLDGYQIAIKSKAEDVIKEIKLIESSMSESTTEPDQEMIRNFWAKYRELRNTVPDTIEVFPNLKSKVVKPKVVIRNNHHNRFFSNLWDGVDDKLDTPYIVNEKPLGSLYEVLREYNISATNVKARSPSYNIWKEAIEQVEGERRLVGVLAAKKPKYVRT